MLVKFEQNGLNYKKFCWVFWQKRKTNKQTSKKKRVFFVFEDVSVSDIIV